MGTPDALSIPAAAAEAMLAHARAALPNEACGLLAGDLRRGHATAFHPARNERASPWRFSLHPADLVRLTLEIDARGEDLVGIFHSHVASPAAPSPADLREGQAYPDAVHVIATLTDAGVAAERALRAWRVVGGRPAEIGLVIG